MEQVIRPTGLLDPRVIVKPVEGQIEDLLGEINTRSCLLYTSLRLVNIQLLEHLIFADNEFLSFVQSNYMDSIRQSVQD